MNMAIMRMIVYQTDPDQQPAEGMLMLMEMTMQKFGVDNQQQEQQLRQQMSQQTQAQRGNQNFKSSKSETREIEIRGEKIPFEFTEGVTSGQGQEKTVHMVSGVFQGKKGPVMIQIVEPDEDYDEEAVVKMLESIK